MPERNGYNVKKKRHGRFPFGRTYWVYTDTGIEGHRIEEVPNGRGEESLFVIPVVQDFQVPNGEPDEPLMIDYHLSNSLPGALRAYDQGFENGHLEIRETKSGLQYIFYTRRNVPKMAKPYW